MGKSLGINVKVDFKEANTQLDAFDKKWKSYGKDPLELKVKIDSKKLNDIKKTISDLGKADKNGIKLKLDTTEATSSLNTFRQKFQGVKKELEQGMNIKFAGANLDSKGMDSVLKSSDKLTGGLKAASKVTTEIDKSYQNLDGIVQKFNKSNIDGIKEASNAHRVLGEMKSKGNSESLRDMMDETAALKEIARLTKEISGLEKQSVGKSIGEVDVLNKRIQTSSTQLKTLKDSYSKAFGQNPNMDWSVKQAQDMGKHNMGIKLSSNEITNRKEATAYTKNLITLENERFSLLQKAEKAGEMEASALREQADMVALKVMRSREYGKEAEMSTADKNRLSDLMRENELIAKASSAKKDDITTNKMISAQQKRAFDDAKTSQKEMFAIQKEITKLEAQESNKTLDTKGRQKLDQLKEELKVSESISDARKKSATEDGQNVIDQLLKEQKITKETHDIKSKQNQANSGLAKEDAERLSIMQKTNAEQMKMVEASSKAQAQTKLQTQEYGKLKESISRVDDLNDKLSKAGREETQQILAAIKAEEDYQNTIRETIKVKGLSNAETDKEVQDIREKQARYKDQNLDIGAAKDQDERRYSGVFATMFDPTRIYQEGKQAALKMYESVKVLDSAFVDIEKVADVPSEVLEEFSNNIATQASAVGKASEDYAVSVERWLTTGRSFQESQDLAQVSSMGGFVGNIGEEEMVKYMSIPLQAYKKDMLEASDVVNAMNEVANNNAIQMDDLGKAYERAGQTASTSGTSFSELTGMITGANVATLAGGEKVGTALKAIDLNFNKMSTGITKDDVFRMSFFEGIGVKIKDGNKQLRSTFDIVGDLEKVWDGLNSDQKGQATLYAAGKNHASIFQGMVNGWGDVVKATKEAEIQLGLTNKESGSAYKEFETQQQSVEFKATALSNSWQELLRTLAGGREGVTGFMDTLQKLVDKGNELANNDKFMDFAKGIGKLVIVMAGVVGAKKGFSVLSDGISDIGLAFGNLKNISKLTKKVGDVTKPLGMLGKVGAGMGSMIPIVGGLIGALTLLDAVTGGKVWDGLSKGMKLTAEQFESAEKKAKRANDEFIKSQEVLSKDLGDNKLLNGSLEKVDELGKSWEDIMAKKEKRRKETGDNNELFLTNEEFGALQSSANQLAEEMGIDIRLTMNDYSTIKKQMEELMNYKNQLTKTELQEVMDGYGKASKTKNLDKDKKAWESDLKDKKASLENQYKSEGAFANADKATKDAYYAETQRMEEELRNLENFYNSKAAIKAAAADKERIANLEQIKNDLGGQAEKGTLNETWGLMKEKDQKDGLVPIVAYGRELEASAKKYKDYKAELDRANKIFEGTDGRSAEINNPEMHEWMKKVTGNENITTNLNQWTSEEMAAIFKETDAQIARSTERTKEFTANVKELATSAGLSGEEFENMVVQMEKGGSEFVQMMADMGGDKAAGMLGLNSLFVNEFKDSGGWEKQAIAFQSQIDKMTGEDIELGVKLNIIGEDGLFVGETLSALSQIPEEINTQFNIIGEDGTVQLQSTIEMLNTLKESDFSFKGEILNPQGDIAIDKFIAKFSELDELGKKDFFAELGVEVTGEEDLNKAKENIDDADGRDAKAKLDLEVSGDNEVNKTRELLDEVDGIIARSEIDVVSGDYSGVTETGKVLDDINGEEATATLNVKEGDVSGAGVVTGIINDIDGEEAKATLNADGSPAKAAVQTTQADIEALNLLKSESLITGNDSHFQSTIQGVKDTPPPSISVTLKGILDGILQRVFGGGSVSINANVSGKASKSVGIIDRNMGRSFSSSIGQAVGVPRNSEGKSYSRSSDRNADAKVNSDVWRYWAQEMFTGLPLERSMENLTNSIKKADDNYVKLIPLYKQQVGLIGKQIAHEKAMQKATQSEMNDTLSKLRAQGFTTKGNQVTNLGRAKSFSGDKASEIDGLLNTWKTLYEGLDTINGKINSLNIDKWEVENDIKDAQISIEAGNIEKSLKKSEALLTTIKNHMSLLSKKESLVSDADMELKLSIQEESSNDAKRNIGQLVDEFNRLSRTTIKYEENADDVQSQMESLKTEILSNADAIIAYRESMNQIRIDRLISDYSKFNDVMERNNGLLNSNIESLKEGLLSGTDMGDLQSSKLENVTFDRKNKLDKQLQDRLQLEAKIDSALDAFAKKNVDRAKNVANAQLQVEKSKYKELLQMEKQYGNGKTPTFKEVAGKNIDIGAIETPDSANNKMYQGWLNKMKEASNQYSKEFSSMRDKYDKDMSKTQNQSQRDSLTNKFIIDQLNLQEKMQRKTIELNNEMIAQAEKELKNTTLTTEQREQLEQAILDYKDSSIESQESIKDIIRSRFELEFDLMDKAVKKAELYSEKLDHLLNIADMVGSSSGEKQGIVDKIYEAKMNEYNNAKQSLEKLQAEQSKYLTGSFEWNILQEKIEEVDGSMRDLTISLLEANKLVLGNKLDSMSDSIVKGALDGKTLDEWKNYQDRWATGIEKEIALDKIRQRLLDIESDVNKERLEILDRQDKVSKRELEYLDKQTKVLELQDKLNNLDKERSIQTLIKKDDGTWDWDYVADQTEIDKTKEELQEAEKDLEAYKQEQRSKYVSDMQDAIDRAKNGEFDSAEELRKELEDIRNNYGSILTEIPNFDMGSIDEILKAYEDYLNENKDILDDSLGGATSEEFEDKLEKVGGMFETSFRAIAEDLGRIISDSLVNALSSVSGMKRAGEAESYVIEHQELVFPNVSDTTGFEEVLRGLPQLAKQNNYSK